MLSFIVFPGGQAGVGSERLPALEAFVLLTLGFLFFLIAVFAICAWRLWRRHRNPPPHVQLLIELEAEDDVSDTHESAPPTKIWERDADWWRKE
jgi:hypothetical protein